MKQKPVRIRRTLYYGWTCPDGAIYCGRPSKYGNPFTVKEYGRAKCLALFRAMRKDKNQRHQIGYPSDETIRRELRGKNLVCWCGLDEDCHVDDLLKTANS